MKLKLLLGASALFALSTFPCHGAEEPKVRPLTLPQAIAGALEGNFDITLTRLEADAATERRKSAEALFDPRIEAHYEAGEGAFPSTSAFADPPVQENSAAKAGVALAGALPTGATYRLSLETAETNSNSSLATLDPAHQAKAGVEVVQPLLRGGGFTAAGWKIIAAKADEGAARKKLEAAMADVIKKTVDAYWDLLYARGRLAADEESHKLALDHNKRVSVMVSAGALAPIEKVSAEATVAERWQVVIEAKNRQAAAEENLLALIEPSIDPARWSERLEPTVFEEEADLLSPAEAVRSALENRPELSAAREEREKERITLAYHENALYPAVDLYGRYSAIGVRGDPTGASLFGEETETSPYSGGSGEALDDALAGKFEDYAVGLRLSWPLAARRERADRAAASMGVARAEAAYGKLERAIILEVRSALRSVASAITEREAAQAARELAQKRVAAELVKFDAGAATSFTVLEYQKELANRKSDEFLATASFHKALAAYRRAIGVSLAAAGYRVE